MPTILPSGQVLRDYSREPAPPMSDRGKARMLRQTLALLMSQIDYTMGACESDIKIGTLVKPDYLDGVRNILELTDERNMDTNRPDSVDLGVQRGGGNLPSKVPSVPSSGGTAQMNTLLYTVLAWAAIISLGIFLIGVFTPVHAGSCTATKGRNTVCRPSPPVCWPGRRCA